MADDHHHRSDKAQSGQCRRRGRPCDPRSPRRNNGDANFSLFKICSNRKATARTISLDLKRYSSRPMIGLTLWSSKQC
jgi:hypothetical protein